MSLTAASVLLLVPGVATALRASPLIAECGGRGGAVRFMARALGLRWRTLVL